MIGRKSDKGDIGQVEKPQGFDDFQLRLGDVLRGERATLGKSLLDVQRELRIKASYIGAIENCDPSAFDTPGFIAGYVRSYARYLGIDPDETFAAFCAESGFSTAHGMSEKASTIRKSDVISAPRARDPLAEPAMPFAPAAESFVSRIEPGAIGSTLVLLALIGGIGYGGWSVLQEVQRVQLAPVEQTPVVLSELDPLDAARAPAVPAETETVAAAGPFAPPTTEAFDRLYRPQALDVPVLVARDAPISTLDPENVGLFAGAARPALPQVQDSSLAADALIAGLTQVPGVNTPAGVTVIAARPAWVEISDADGSVLLSRILNGGETYTLPQTAEGAQIDIGESGAVYFAVNGAVLGPAGRRGAVTSNLPLDGQGLSELFTPADTQADTTLAGVLADIGFNRIATAQADVIQTDVAEAVAQVVADQQVRPVVPARPAAPALPNGPRVLADAAPGVTIVAVSETWVEVTSAAGKKLLAKVMQPGDTYVVPQTEQAPTVFSGNAGGVYFAVNGQTYGPYGESGQFGRGLALSSEDVTQKMAVADLSTNGELARVVAELNAAALSGATE
jgi:cytoskeletal protein RodZ